MTTPEQADKISLAAATISAYSNGDHQGLEALAFGELGRGDESFHKGVELADGLTLLAAESVFTAAQLRRISADQVLEGLPECDEGFVAGAHSHWGEAVAAVRDILQKRIPAPSESLPDALTSAFNVAFALQSDLAARAGVPTGQFASMVAREFRVRAG